MRRWAAAEALSLGRGGTAAVSRATGIAESTIRRGRRELACEEQPEPGRVRRPGAGRKPLTETDQTLLGDLEALVDENSRGDPEAPLRWTAKSLRNLASELRGQGHQISAASVAPLLRRLGYSLQANAKTREGASHPDRDAQFHHINETVKAALAEGEPTISVDTKKKELIGDFKNGGRELRPKGSPERVRTHDFKDKELGKVNPYGIYDVAEDAGWVSVGIDNDTAQFAVESIRGWWEQLGSERYPDAATLTITPPFRRPPPAGAPPPASTSGPTPRGSRSQTPSSPPSSSKATRSTPSGTTPSSRAVIPERALLSRGRLCPAWLSQSSHRRLGHEWATKCCHS